MQVSISGKQMKVPASFKQAVDAHLLRPLQRFYDDQAAELHVEVGNALPGKGGEHIECHLTLRMPHGKTLHIEDVAKDPLASLGVAAERLLRAVKKELEKMREPGGHQREHPLANSVDE